MSAGWKLAGPDMQEPSRFTLTLRVLHAGRASRNIDFLLRSHLVRWNLHGSNVAVQEKRLLPAGPKQL
jgi:hypothetical protein